MAHPFYNITVKPDQDGFGYVLFNEASGATCGDRLFKGNAKSQWPFPNQREWWKHDELKDAERAARLLQSYLDQKPAGEESSAQGKKGKETE